MTPKGFSGVTWRSMSVVVVTALVLMDTVATDVGEDEKHLRQLNKVSPVFHSCSPPRKV